MMDDLDALLADLQSTTAHLNSTPSYKTIAPTSNYHGSSSPRFQPRSVSRSPIINRKVITEKYEYKPRESPIYQNQDFYLHDKPKDQSNLNANLSELDSLLEELNSARYGSYPTRKVPPSPVLPHRTISPTLQRQSLQEHNSSVESLLDDLQSAVPNQPVKHSPLVTRRTVITTTTKKTPSKPVPSSTFATKDLDDLMACLTDFQPSSRSPPLTISEVSTHTPSRDPKITDEEQLHSMLDDLQSNMSQQGADTKTCAFCLKSISGKAVNALGKTWHPEHFTCYHCKQELANKTFFEKEGRTYCEGDYHKIFAPKCAHCNGPILDRCVTALDKTWHPEHFLCAKCGGKFGEDGYHEKEGKAYCKRDYLDLFAPKCGGCKGPITENYISALDKSWHPDCFKCRECHAPFEKGSFYDHEGEPYCEYHYHETRRSLCASCQKPITGRCVTAMFRKFHPEHFVCSFCLKQLNKGTFKENKDKPYCHVCFDKLFA
ncbi:paxillin-like isoform X2 [Centruroides vittatus]|uniref:paxillin-like isoform X2 n=1 Tax=Centruroides vittatus TaxID=120091 RepID=UPI00350FFBCF